MKNMYQSAVSPEGNQKAKSLIDKYFEAADDYWRGNRNNKKLGAKAKNGIQDFDAGSTILKMLTLHLRAVNVLM